MRSPRQSKYSVDAIARHRRKPSASTSRAIWIGLVCALVLTGCEYEDPFGKPYTPPKQNAVQTKQKLSIAGKIMPFVYVPIKKRDPFRSPAISTKTSAPIETTKQTPSAIAPKRPRVPQTELEKFEIDQITVVATVTGVANPVAMVEGPNGRGFLVRRGTSIGKNGGRVTRIYSTGIVISEVSRDNAGRRIVSRVMIRIKGDKASKTDGDVQIGGRKLYFDDTGTPRYQFNKGRTDAQFRKRGVGAP